MRPIITVDRYLRPGRNGNENHRNCQQTKVLYNVDHVTRKMHFRNGGVELGGWISRKSKLSEVLRRIELAGNVNFKIEGRRIIVER